MRERGENIDGGVGLPSTGRAVLSFRDKYGGRYKRINGVGIGKVL